MLKLNIDYAAATEASRNLAAPKEVVVNDGGTIQASIEGASLYVDTILRTATMIVATDQEPRVILVAADWLLRYRDHINTVYLSGYAAEAADVALKWRGLRGELAEVNGTYPVLTLSPD